MKRFHVHAHVENLEASIAFYSTMFAARPPAREQFHMWSDIPVSSQLVEKSGSRCCARAAPANLVAVAMKAVTSCCP